MLFLIQTKNALKIITNLFDIKQTQTLDFLGFFFQKSLICKIHFNNIGKKDRMNKFMLIFEVSYVNCSTVKRLK